MPVNKAQCTRVPVARRWKVFPAAKRRVANQIEYAHLDRVLVGIHEHDPAGTIEPVPPSHLEEDFATREPQGSGAHAGVHAVAPNAGVGLAVGKRRARAVAGALEKFLGVHVRAKRSHLLDISNATFVPSGLPYRMSPRHQLGNFSPLDPKALSGLFSTSTSLLS